MIDIVRPFGFEKRLRRGQAGMSSSKVLGERAGQWASDPRFIQENAVEGRPLN
ncbi:MAG: hypothetical protein ACLQL2_06705 [Methylovirgula sp.]